MQRIGGLAMLLWLAAGNDDGLHSAAGNGTFPRRGNIEPVTPNTFAVGKNLWNALGEVQSSGHRLYSNSEYSRDPGESLFQQIRFYKPHRDNSLKVGLPKHQPTSVDPCTSFRRSGSFQRFRLKPIIS